MKRDDHDDHDDRKDRKDRWEEQIEAAYQRVQAGLPPEPWLPNLPTLTGLRRQVRRARAGVIRPGNPRIPVRAWADTIEQGIVMNMLEREEVRKQIEEEKRQEAEYQQRVLEYNRWWMDVYRALKRLPEASDPDSDVAAQLLSMKRELRKLRGRPRKRKRGKTRQGPDPE
jgi:predicted CopG family antitoxin